MQDSGNYELTMILESEDSGDEPAEQLIKHPE